MGGVGVVKASDKCVPSHRVTQGFIKTLGPSRGTVVPGLAGAWCPCERGQPLDVSAEPR